MLWYVKNHPASHRIWPASNLMILHRRLIVLNSRLEIKKIRKAQYVPVTAEKMNQQIDSAHVLIYWIMDLIKVADMT